VGYRLYFIRKPTCLFDPLSPMLFNIVADMLAVMIESCIS
jgi:hypothetical protein